MKNIPKIFRIALAEILGAQYGTRAHRGAYYHVLNELHLGRERYRRHFLLRYPSEHERVRRGDGCQHKALQSYRKREDAKPFIKLFIVYLHSISMILRSHAPIERASPAVTSLSVIRSLPLPGA